jgi:transcriptional regulator with XRE-family HTH domain
MGRASLGEAIRLLREDRRLSQSELAAELGVSQKLISAYERNYRTPSADRIPLIAETLGTTADDLLGLSKTSNRWAVGLRKARLWRVVERLDALPPKRQERALSLFEKQLDRMERTGGD